ncbi:MAG: hypothetical protein K0U20_08255 [Proteobacteria bacterium]|nr:hypothetical protein [Pseudomonadota bacterium]
MNTYNEAKDQKFSNETNDCSVVALSIACDISYADAHAALAARGRPARRGAYTHQSIDAAKDLGYTVHELEGDELVNPETGCGYTATTIGQLCKKGRFMVQVHRHIFAVVDGQVQDWTKGRRHRVKRVMEVTTGAAKPKVATPVKRLSIKDQVREALMKRYRTGYTISQLARLTGGTESTVRTAIADLKNPKYCGKGGPLNISKTANPHGARFLIIR